MKIILGLIGTIGSGKDFAAEYLVEKHGFKSMSMGDLVREETINQGLEPTRSNLQSVSKSFTDKNGPHYWSNKVCDKILKLGWEKVIINGVRRVQELETYREKFGSNFNLVLIDADPKIRFNRLKSRARVGFPNTWGKFAKHEKAELELYGTFEDTIKLAEFVVKNESSPEELHKNIDNVLNKLGIL